MVTDDDDDDDNYFYYDDVDYGYDDHTSGLYTLV